MQVVFPRLLLAVVIASFIAEGSIVFKPLMARHSSPKNVNDRIRCSAFKNCSRNRGCGDPGDVKA